MKNSILKRILALVLCAVMLVPYLEGLPLHTLAAEANPQSASDEPLAVVGAGSDFQYLGSTYNGVTYEDDYQANKAMVLDIFNRIKVDYPKLDGYLVCGDYDGNDYVYETSTAGIAAAYSALNETFGLTHDQIQFVQGNHDPITAEGLDSTGAYDREHYGVFQINHEDYSWSGGNQAKVQAVAQQLDAYLDAKAEEGYRKPIFVITHVHLHHSFRANATTGITDNRYARYLVDVLNEGGSKGLNIVFMYGHNHSGAYDQYLGRDCVYLQPGMTMPVTVPETGTVDTYEDVTLNFTYMNPGYLGYAGDTLSSTVFEIYEDRMIVNRYSKNGIVPLKKAGTNSTDERETWAANTAVIYSPDTISFSDITLELASTTMGDTLSIGQVAALEVSVESANPYRLTWSVEDAGVVTVAQDGADPTKATLTGMQYGTTTVKVVAEDLSDANAIPATLELKVTVAPENAVMLNDSENSNLYKLVTDWSTVEPTKRYLLLNSNTEGEALSMGGPSVGSGREEMDPATLKSGVHVFRLPGMEGLYTTAATEYDAWELSTQSGADYSHLKQSHANQGIIAITKAVDTAMSYSYLCGIRFASSYTSSGSARWTVDAENQKLVLHSYYYSGGFVDAPGDYALYFNSTENRFEISATAGDPVYLYEWTGKEGPETYIWLTGESGQIPVNGDQVTGATVMLMADGQIQEQPITPDMMREAYPSLPGSRTCAIYYNGKLLTDEFQLTVTGDNGELVEPVPLLVNEGTLFKLVIGDLPGTATVLSETRVAGDGYALAAKDGALVRVPAKLFQSDYLEEGGVYLQTQEDGWIFDLEQYSGHYYYMKNRGTGSYLHAYGDSEVLDLSATGTVAWRQNSTYRTISTWQDHTGGIQRTVKWDGSGYYAPNRDAGGYYTFCLDTTLDRVLAYASSNTGTIRAGTPGLVEGVQITVAVYNQDGSHTDEVIPVTTSMLNVSQLDLFAPGNYLCTLTYEGAVLCEEFLLCVEEAEGDPVADDPVIYAEAGEFFKMSTTITAGQPLLLVNSNQVGQAAALSVDRIDGGYTYPAVPVEVFTLNGRTEANGTDSLFVVCKDKNSVFVPVVSSASGKYYLFNEKQQGYIYGNNAAYNLEFVTEKPENANYIWRYSGTQKAILTTGDTIVINKDGIFDLTDYGGMALEVRPQAYVRDDTVDTILAYVDSLSGECNLGAEGSSIGGNVVFKIIQKEGTVQVQTVPITLEMLDLTTAELMTPGSYTCKVFYNGVEITDEYCITIISDTQPATDPVDVTGQWSFYQLVPKGSFGAGNDYILVNSNTAGDALALTTVQTAGSWQTTATETLVVDYDGVVYAVVKDPDWLWSAASHTATKPDGSTVTGLSLLNKGSNRYLDSTTDYTLALQEGAPATSAWRYTTNGFVASSQGLAVDADLATIGGEFVMATRAVANQNRHVYAYKPASQVQGMVLFADSLEGSCTAGSPSDTAAGGMIHINSLVNGVIHRQQVPITLDMLSVTADQLMIPGTYTCTLTYQGEVLADNYQLTVIGAAGENPPAKDVVTMIGPDDLVFRSTTNTWGENIRWVMAEGYTEGEVQMLGVNTVNGVSSIVSKTGYVFTVDNSEYSYMVVRDPSMIFATNQTLTTTTGQTVSAVANQFLVHEQTGQYLFVDSNRNLHLTNGDTVSALPNGWRNSAGVILTGRSDLPPYAELVVKDGTVVTRDRYGDASALHLYLEEDTINTRLGYVDSLAGSCDVAAASSTVCGGNVVIKTRLEDGTVETRVVPITLSMLSLDYSQLMIAGTYTCSVTYEDVSLTDEYRLTVNALPGEKPAATQPVTLIAEGDKVYRLHNNAGWMDTAEIMLVTTGVAGEAKAVAITVAEDGSYAITAVDAEAFTIGTDGQLYTVAQEDNQIWVANKTVTVDGISVSTSSAASFFLANYVYDGYLFSNADYELGFVDAKTAAGIPNGWRVSSKTAVTGSSSGQLPYADLSPRGDTFIARYRHATSGATVDTAHIYIRDNSVRLSMAYLDQTTGSSTVDNTESYACGGNLIIKTVLTDGTVVTDQVPITMDMLQLSYGQKHTAGTYICPVVYRGQVIFDSYELTVTDENAQDRASDTVVIFDDEDTIYTAQSPQIHATKTYMFVDSKTPGAAYALANGADGSVAAVPVEIFTIDGGTAPYVVASDNHWIWTAESRYIETNDGIVRSLYNPATGQYLYVNKNGQLVICGKNESIPFNSGWLDAGNNGALGNGSANQSVYVTIRNVDGSFQAVDRKADNSDIDAAFIYMQDQTLEGQIAYLTALEGSCPVGSTSKVALGGSLVLRTYHTDGTATVEEIPVTLNMLKGLDPMDLFEPGTYTCTLEYNGQLITDSYALTITEEGGDVASKPVSLVGEGTQIFRRVDALTHGEHYVFVNSKTDGVAQVLAVKERDGKYILSSSEIMVIEDETSSHVVVSSDAWIWQTAVDANGRYTLTNQTAGQQLLAEGTLGLTLGTHTDNTYGWRLSSAGNLGANGEHYYTDVVNNGTGYYMQYRTDSSDKGYTYAYRRDDSVTAIIAYMDSLTGSIAIGQTGLVRPGGNVVIQTIYADGSISREVVPVSLDMLGLTLAQLNTPGEYTTTVSFGNWAITDEYVLTVTGEAVDNMVESDGDGITTWGYLAAVDRNYSDDIPVNSGGRVPTGSTIALYTYYMDGSVECTVVPVTVDMLNVTQEQMTTSGTYENMTLTYHKMVITDDYTLTMVQQVQDDYPDFPNEGSVKVDKQMDTTKYNYLQTGTAQIDLSVAGIPITSSANVVVILDASSSMLACTHGIYANSDIKETERAIIDKALAMNQTLTAEEITFLQSLDFSAYDDAQKYQNRMQALIDRTITASEMVALKRGLRTYGLCYQADTDSYKWVGDGEEQCKRRSTITKEALAELLEFLQQDIDGYDMDIDVAVAYFNQLYATDPDLTFINDDPLVITPRSADELMLPFTNAEDVKVDEVLSRYKTISGTNYDRGMEWIYQLLSEKQTADYQQYLAGDTSQPYKARKDFVLFMSDGVPGQFNYMLTNNASEFAQFYQGKISVDKLQDYVSEENLPAFREMYNPEGKLWLAEAIKGDKTQLYKIIDPSMPETNYVNYVSGLDATMMTVTLNSYAPVMYRIASSEDYYIPTETADDIQQAFGVFGSLVTSGSGAYFMDQMGSEFDLQTRNEIVPANIKDMYLSQNESWDTFSGTKSTRTVYFDAYGQNWNGAWIYTWDGSSYPTGTWPGTKMTHLGNSIYAFEVPNGVRNVIFHNNSGTQTTDLSIPTDSRTYYTYSGKTWKTFATRTIYLDATGCNWTGSKLYAYTWGGSGISTTGTWPGSPVIHLGGNIYSCEIPADATQIIFNNNSGSQTADLTIPTGENSLYRFSTGKWDTYETRTIYFDNSGKNWSSVCAYTWDANGNYTTTAWPGIPMTHVGGGIYSCKIPADTVNIQFNNGTNAGQIDGLTLPPTVIELNSTITVSKYPLYKYSEHLDDPDLVPMDKVGKRKEGVQPEVIEVVTFSNDGTQAFSNLIGGGKTNILIDGVICAESFWYNTNTGSSVMIDTNGNGTTETALAPETFYWKVDAIPEDELVLSYNVYLTGTLEGIRQAGSYPTNDHAILYYTNHLDHACQLDTTSPVLPWNQAVVGYAFYLVDNDGNPIVNEDEHITGSFEKAIRMTQPQYIDLLYNSAANVEPWELKASDVLPAGYTLFDPSVAYHVALYANGEGSWTITGSVPKDTTYVTGYGGVPTTDRSATAGMSTATQTYDYPAYATSSTVVWFAVRANVNTVPDTVVIDFGLSVDIHVLANDVVITDQNSVIAGLSPLRPAAQDGVDFTTEAAADLSSTYQGTFGTATVRGNVVRYTLNTMQMTAEDRFSYCAEYQGNKNPGFYYADVAVIPASNIYFEDNFVTFDGDWEQVGQTNEGAVQDEDRQGSFSLPQVDANNLYGYDSAYKNMTTYSMGSAMKFRTSEGKDATAVFTFTGTGFDIVSLCSSDTGAVMVSIYEGDKVDDSKLFESMMVDTYYGATTNYYQVTYVYSDSQWIEAHKEAISKDQMGTSQAVPANPTEGTQYVAYESRKMDHWMITRFR